MRPRRMTRLAAMSLAGFLMLAGVGILSGVAPAAQTGSGSKFEGTWINSIRLVTCPPAPYVVLSAFESMTSTLRGGVLIESGPPPFPAVSRSSGQGIWERTGGQSMRLFFRAHFFDIQGRLIRIAEVAADLTLVDGDNPETPDIDEPYYLTGTGTATVTNLNPADGAVVNTMVACPEVTSRPVLFEH